MSPLVKKILIKKVTSWKQHQQRATRSICGHLEVWPRCESIFILAGHKHRQWPAEGLSSTHAPGQPVPHRPLTRHGATLFNLVHSALPVPSCRLFQQVAGLPSLASWGSMRVFLAAAAATADAAGLNILSTSTSTDLQLPMDSSMQASMPGHAPKCRLTRARTSGERIPSSSSR